MDGIKGEVDRTTIRVSLFGCELLGKRERWRRYLLGTLWIWRFVLGWNDFVCTVAEK